MDNRKVDRKQTRANKPGDDQSGGDKRVDPHHQDLEGVGDAPESGEPEAVGRSRGHVIDPDGEPAGDPQARTKGRQPSTKATQKAAEHWESGRQKAME